MHLKAQVLGKSHFLYTTLSSKVERRVRDRQSKDGVIRAGIVLVMALSLRKLQCFAVIELDSKTKGRTPVDPFGSNGPMYSALLLG